MAHTLEVSGFGPVANGAVDLKPLTIFVGRNNSGKSYVAMLLYALHRALGTNLRLVGRRRNLRSSTFAFSPFLLPWRRRVSAPTAEQVRNWLREIVEVGPKRPEFSYATLPPFLRENVDLGTKDYFNYFLSALRQELERCYGADISALVRPETFRLKLNQPRWQTTLSLENGNIEPTTPTFDLSSVRFGVPPFFVRPLAQSTIPDDRIEAILEHFTEGAITALTDSLPGLTYYFPAARSGILHSHKILASFFVRQSPLVGLQQIEIPKLSGVITDFIVNLLQLDTRIKTELFDIGSILEKDILGGVILIEPEKLQYPEIFYESKAGRFPLHRTSSMVSELAPIVLFLKYLIEPGDFVIIEEPESHLHPANQRKLAFGIAMLIRKGVRVLVTTHSDYFLGQLSNFLRLSKGDVRARNSEKYGSDMYLQPDEVAAYLFNLRDDGDSLVHQMEINTEEGIPETEFTKVAEALYDETVELQ